MGFFFNTETAGKGKAKPKQQNMIQLAKTHQCKVCTLKRLYCESPKMEPSGSDNPVLYVLGENASSADDMAGKHFIDEAGAYLRDDLYKIFGEHEDKQIRAIPSATRYNNIVRCHTPKGRMPTELEVEACRQSIEDDIEKTKPTLILGLGYLPLKWMLKVNMISDWRGRFVPVRIGSHDCWFLPITEPSFVLDKRKKKFPNQRTEFDIIFRKDIESIADHILRDEEPVIIDSGYKDNIQIVMGNKYEDLEILRKHLERIAKYPRIGLDIEANTLRPYTKGSKLLTMAVGTYDDVVSFPIEHPDAWKGNYAKIHALVKWFLLESGVKSAHFLKFELEWMLHRYGDSVLFDTEWDDTGGQAYAIDERSSKTTDSNLSLNSLTLQHFGFRIKEISDLDRSRLIEYPLRKVLYYNGIDTKYEFLLDDKQRPEIPESVMPTYLQSLDTCRTLARTQNHGIYADAEEARKIGDALAGTLDKIATDIQHLPEVEEFKKKSGKQFSPSKDKQLAIIFRDILKLKQVKATPTGDYSTDKDVLEKFAEDGITLATMIQEHRELAKLKSTYVDSIHDYISPDGLIHSEFNHLFTRTGRLSSEKPNMQNFPKRKHHYIRRIISAPEGYFLVLIDYGQIEARVIAMASHDKLFCKAIREDYDIHMDWALRACELFPKAAGVRSKRELQDDIKKLKAWRGKIKNGLVFPLFYGASPMAISYALGIPKEVSFKLCDEFWDTYKDVKKWQDTLVKGYEKNGYVETLTGRRRHGTLKYNEIINTPIQGTASDIVVTAMNNLSKKSYEEDNPTFQARLNVHDDLTFLIPEETLEEDIYTIAGEMCKSNFDFINVPLSVEVSVGKNWAECEEIAEFKTDDFDYN
ncbi:MAG: hypothetical protein KAR06_00375 [Deltaproteobacteria bacterium]|nr:hypothetical protein [Deltaproteobacteria bacterium]